MMDLDLTGKDLNRRDIRVQCKSIMSPAQFSCNFSLPINFVSKDCGIFDPLHAATFMKSKTRAALFCGMDFFSAHG